MLSGTTYDIGLFLAGESLATLGAIEIGISSSATSFGTLVHSAAPTSTTTWTQVSHTFIASSNASYLTLRTSSTPDEMYAFVDDVSLVAVPEPSTALLLGLGLASFARRRENELVE
jgi:hypothetical protein